MTSPTLDDVVAALREFVDRIDALDPAGDPVGVLEARAGDDEVRLTVRAPVARALVEALRSYHDPRDRGTCDHCGGRRLDDNFLCLDCQRPNGLFGQLVMERAARYAGDPAGLTAESWGVRHHIRCQTPQDSEGAVWRNFANSAASRSSE